VATVADADRLGHRLEDGQLGAAPGPPGAVTAARSLAAEPSDATLIVPNSRERAACPGGATATADGGSSMTTRS